MGIINRLFGPIDIEKAKEKKDLKSLTKALKNKDINIREKAINALEDIGDDRSINALFFALYDENKDIRNSVADTIVKLGWKPSNDIERVIYLIAKHRWSDLKEIPINSFFNTYQYLYKSKISNNYFIKYNFYLIAILCDIGETSISNFHSTLLDREKNSSYRSLIAIALGAINNPQSVEPLVKILIDKKESMRLRLSSGLALMCLGKSAVLPMLSILTAEDIDIDARTTAAQILASIGKPSVNGLINALDNKLPRVRAYAVIALVGTGDFKAINELYSRSNDKNLDVKQMVIDIQKKLGTPSIDSFLSLLHDDLSVFRFAAASALGNLGDSRALQPLIHSARSDEDATVRNVAFFSIAEMIENPDIEKILIDALSGKNNVERLISILFLLKSGFPIFEHL